MTGGFDLGGHVIERIAIKNVERRHMIGRVALEIHQGVITRVATHLGLVGAKVRRLALAPDQLQADDAGGEIDRRIEIGRTDAQIADVEQIDHGGSLSGGHCFAGVWAGTVLAEASKSAITGLEPHMQSENGSNGNWRGR